MADGATVATTTPTGDDVKVRSESAMRVLTAFGDALQAQTTIHEPVELTSTGHVEAQATVEGRSQVTGTLKTVHFREGEMVKAGQQIGLVGATGRVTGPHLHLGVNILGVAVDPLSLVPKQ